MKSKLFKYFKNKVISITIKDVKNKTGNMSFIGFLLDHDDDFYYLGDSEKGDIEAAIPKTQNAAITLITENDLLIEIDIPEDQEVQ